MFNAANPVGIFVPMLVARRADFYRLRPHGRGRAVRRSRRGIRIRTSTARTSARPSPRRRPLPSPLPATSFELPTLLYAACLTAFVLGAVSQWTLIFAWAYVAARVVQSLVHMTSNNTNARGGGFVLGVVCMLALWVNVGMAVGGKL